MNLVASVDSLPDGAIQTARGIRVRTERALLRGTLALFLLIMAGVVTVSGGVGALLVISWLLSGPLLALFQGSHVLRSAAVVGPACCAEWHGSIQRARAWLQLEARDHSQMLVYQDPQLNAAALWWPGRPLLLLTSGLVERFAQPEDDALRRAIWGHEIGHTLWHQPWRLWAWLPAGGPALLRLPWIPLVFMLKLLTLAWSRQAEQSADRLALIASGSLLATVSALVTVATGVRPADAEALRAQLQLQAATRVFGLDWLIQLNSTHPFLWWRVRRLTVYALSPEFAQVVGAQVACAVQAEAAALSFAEGL
jgi:Zn-dependent protease with chaperone function